MGYKKKGCTLILQGYRAHFSDKSHTGKLFAAMPDMQDPVLHKPSYMQHVENWQKACKKCHLTRHNFNVTQL